MKRGHLAQTHCAKGHSLLDEANLYIRENGYQECRTCRAQARKEYKSRQNALRRPGVKVDLVVVD